METAILMGLVGIGYLANNSNRDEAHPEIHPEINTPTHSTVYDQNNFEESKKEEELLAKNIIDSMKRERESQFKKIGKVAPSVLKHCGSSRH